MDKSIVLPVGTLKISVSDAISKTLESAAFPEVFDIYLEISTDDKGNEYCKPDAQAIIKQSDGKTLAADSIKSSFLAFCEATATKPTSPYAPWIFDYDGANQYHDTLYQITVEEMRQFALNYGINVFVAESSTVIDSHISPLSKGADSTDVDSDKNKPVELHNWMMLVQTEAAIRWRRYRMQECNPTRHMIADELAKWCRDTDIRTKSNINPTVEYLHRHVLSKRCWTPPDDS